MPVHSHVGTARIIPQRLERCAGLCQTNVDGAAMDHLGNGEKWGVRRYANNRVENSHLPFRRRERAMQRFRRMKTLQKFASVHANVANHFFAERHFVSRQEYKLRRSAALAAW